MKVIYTEKQRLHHVRFEFLNGEATPCFEKPERADMVLSALNNHGGFTMVEPNSYGDAPLRWVHTDDYVDFLASCWDQWVEAFGDVYDASPYCFAPARHLRNRIPKDIEGRLGYYSFDMTAAITAGSWKAIVAATECALTGVDLIKQGEHAAFALCRPPGHHAASDLMGGYCYANNAAIAAESFIRQGAKRVAVLDIDYHHGNGTQSIFYNRNDVLFASIHGDPDYDYPHYLGFADEEGEGEGLGFNLNLPLPLHTTDWSVYEPVLAQALTRIADYKPEALVISLGMDTFADDPISYFKLMRNDYQNIGWMIGLLNIPTLFVFEGGYAVDDLGHNTVAVLDGFNKALV